MNELNLNELLKIFKKNWWKIAVITLAVMLIAACFTHYLIPKKYSSTIEFYVVNINTDYDYTSSSLLSASSYLINDYVAIIKSEHMLVPLCDAMRKEGYTDLTPDDIDKMISHSSKSDTSVFTLTVESTDKVLAYKLADQIAKTAPGTITDIAKSDEGLNTKLAERVWYVVSAMSINSSVTKSDVETFIRQNKLGLDERADCIAVLSYPVEAKTHDSPSLVVNTLVAGVIAAVLAYCIYLLCAMLKQTIVTEDDVKTMMKYPLLGTIPHWEQATKSAERSNQ